MHVRNRVRASHFFCAHACSAFPIPSLFCCHGFCKLPSRHTLPLSPIASLIPNTGAACHPCAKSKKPRHKKSPKAYLNIIGLICAAPGSPPQETKLSYKAIMLSSPPGRYPNSIASRCPPESHAALSCDSRMAHHDPMELCPDFCSWCAYNPKDVAQRPANLVAQGLDVCSFRRLDH